jgi:hypothetical protein
MKFYNLFVTGYHRWTNCWFFRPIIFGDNLRDCRKSLKWTILAILHVMKSISYEYQKHKFRVFRQSLQENQISLNFDILRLSYKNQICQKQCFCPKNNSGLNCDMILRYLRNFRCLILVRNCRYLRSALCWSNRRFY